MRCGVNQMLPAAWSATFILSLVGVESETLFFGWHDFPLILVEFRWLVSNVNFVCGSSVLSRDKVNKYVACQAFAPASVQVLYRLAPSRPTSEAEGRPPAKKLTLAQITPLPRPLRVWLCARSLVWGARFTLRSFVV